MYVEIINSYKRKEKNDILKIIPIYRNDDLIGFLRPITSDYKITMPNLIEILSKWRKDNPTAGTGKFEVTNERTENWLNKYILDNDKRILFVILDEIGNYIGQMGFGNIDIENNSVDIDAVIRGNKIAKPGIMTDALYTLIRWGKEVLLVDRFFLDVFNDNQKAINFYKRIGFYEIEKIALEKIEYKDEIKWEINTKIDPNKADKCYIRMILGGR